jgi:SAM-dependent methyltransferase
MTEPESRWGAAAIDLEDPALPSLKARFLVDHAPRTGSLCEIGSGDGKLLRTLQRERPELELHGCDVRAPTRAPEGYAFRLVTGERLPYDDASFDVVIVFDVLEHVPDPESMLDEARRILRPSGKVILFVPIEGEALSFYRLYRRVLGDDTFVETKEHIQAFTHEDLRRMLSGRFQATEVRYAYHLLGHFMDASFFAAARMKWLRRFWWKDNTYYNEEPRGGLASRALNGALRLGNRVAFVESSLLQGVEAGAAGLLYAGIRC